MTKGTAARPADAPECVDAGIGLSPWPALPEGVAAARAALREAKGLASLNSASDAEVDRLGATAAALVEREAAGAPQAVKDEAVVRFVGYMALSRSGGISKASLGPQLMEYVTNHSAMFRHCGAKALLGPFKVRRAGAIG